jgi:hypothetical protein
MRRFSFTVILFSLLQFSQNLKNQKLTKFQENMAISNAITQAAGEILARNEKIFDIFVLEGFQNFNEILKNV